MLRRLLIKYGEYKDHLFVVYQLKQHRMGGSRNLLLGNQPSRNNCSSVQNRFVLLSLTSAHKQSFVRSVKANQYVEPESDARLIPRSFLPIYFEDVLH